VVEVGEAHRSVVGDEEDAVGLELLPPRGGDRRVLVLDAVFELLEREVAREREHEHAVGARDARELGEPEILVVLVEVSEDRVVQHEIE
jgi:hypothetical protein